jgi:hypothetical protein
LRVHLVPPGFELAVQFGEFLRHLLRQVPGFPKILFQIV